MVADVVRLELFGEALVLHARLARSELIDGRWLRHGSDVAQPWRRAKAPGAKLHKPRAAELAALPE